MRTTRFVFGAAALALAAAAGVAQTVPAGFAYDQLISNLDQPTGLAFLPDGRILACEATTGAIRVYAGGVGNSMPVIGTVPSNTVQSIAVDPQWPSRPFIYVSYRWYTGNLNLRLSMFTVSGALSDPTSTNLALGAQYDIITDIPNNQSYTNSAGVRFGLDGKLYVSIGDDGGGGCVAQDLNSELGCVLRLDVSALPGVGAGPPPKSTLVPAGNPFTGPTDNARLVWAYGLRKPYRFHVDSMTGYLDITDLGSAFSEFDECTAGGQNFGWPWFDGNAPYGNCGTQPSLVAPMSTGAQQANWVCGMGRYRNVSGGPGSFGPAYEGDYFYQYLGPLSVGIINRIHWNGSAWVSSSFATDVYNVCDAQLGPDGALYFVRTWAGAGQFPLSGSLARIRGVPTPPTPVLTMISGNDQAANAGQPLQNPLVVRVATPGGTPLAGSTVSFTVTAGGGAVNPASAVADSQGYAQTAYTMPSTSGFYSPVTFNATWRGLTVSYLYFPPALNLITIAVRHSQANSPLTLGFETPPAGAPYLSTPWNAVWTSVLSPVWGFAALDGLGLVGPPNPAIRTPANSTLWLLSISNLPPLGNVPFLLQAYSVDTSRLPDGSAYMISNPITVTIN
jgi:glucose/arabinose dehydrogenase